MCRSPSKNVENHTLNTSFSFYHCGRALARDSAIIIGIETGKTAAENRKRKNFEKSCRRVLTGKVGCGIMESQNGGGRKKAYGLQERFSELNILGKAVERL